MTIDFNQNTVLADSPLVFYLLNQTSGTSVPDVSGNGKTGTIGGTVTYGINGPLDQGGSMGAGLQLDGSSGYVALPSSIDLSTYSAFTVECWLNLNNTSYTQTGRVIASGHTDSNDTGFQFCVGPMGSGGFSDIGMGSSQYDAYFSGASFTAGKWYLLTMTWDSATNTINNYINGVLNSSTTTSGTMASSGYAINIGRNPQYQGDYIPAAIARAAFFGKALSQARIVAHWSSAHTIGIAQRLVLGVTQSQGALTRLFIGIGMTRIAALRCVLFSPFQSATQQNRFSVMGYNGPVGSLALSSTAHLTYQINTLNLPDTPVFVTAPVNHGGHVLANTTFFLQFSVPSTMTQNLLANNTYASCLFYASDGATFTSHIFIQSATTNNLFIVSCTILDTPVYTKGLSS